MKRIASTMGAIWLAAVWASADPGETVPVSVATASSQVVGTSSAPSISADGRYLAFASSSPNMVPGDTNSMVDIFVRDLWLRTTRRISVSTMGQQGNNASAEPAISANGRFVAFRSLASNLVPGDTNDVDDIFVRDLHLGTTVRASISATGIRTINSSSKPSISADGRFVAFDSLDRDLVPGDTNPWSDVFVRDMVLGTVERVSVSSMGLQSTGVSFDATISANGRFVVFTSSAPGLVPGDANGTNDLFVRDLLAQTTTFASLSWSGQQEDHGSLAPSLSADGRFVAFRSSSTNLTPDDTNVYPDIFVRDLVAGTIVRASVTATGTGGFGTNEEPSMSADGRYVTFESRAKLAPEDTNNWDDVYVRDLHASTTTLVSWALEGQQANDHSGSPTISGDGSRVAFHSLATNFMPGDTNGQQDVFVRDRGILPIARANLTSDAAMGNAKADAPTISSDGRFVAFESQATDLVRNDLNNQPDVFLRDVDLGTTLVVSVAFNGIRSNNESSSPSIGLGGRLVAFDSLANNLVLNDTNGVRDVFIRDLEAWTTERVSLPFMGAEGNGASSEPSISEDGRYVAFVSSANNMVTADTNAVADVFLRDRTTSFTERVSIPAAGGQSNGASSSPKFSADGRVIAFVSSATNLTANDTNSVSDVFLRTLATDTTRLVSMAVGGGPANGFSDSPSPSADGRYVAFASLASNLVAGDTNSARDVFVRDVQTGTTQRVSLTSAGGQPNGGSQTPTISADGRYVAFESTASNLVPGDTNGRNDLFVRDLVQGTTRRVSVNSAGDPANDLVGAPSISGNGKYVSFESWATNLTSLTKLGGSADVFRHEVPPHQTAISGTIVLNDFTGPRAAPAATFELVPVGGGATITVGPVALSAGGAYTFSTYASGTHDLYVKASTFLRRKYAGAIAVGGGPVSGLDFVLVNGDVDGSNAIDLDDFLILAAHYESVPVADLRPDLNGDEAVNLDDFLILAANYELSGD